MPISIQFSYVTSIGKTNFKYIFFLPGISIRSTTDSSEDVSEAENDNDSVVSNTNEDPINAFHTIPKILQGPANTSSFLNDRVELICKTTGLPSPKVIWHSKREGKLPKIGQHYRIHKNGSLIFRDIAKRDEGQYKCTARNAAGSDQSKFASLTVEGTSTL